MKLLSDAAEYGLRAVIMLSQRPGETLKVREIAEATRSAPGYLVKVLQSLSKAGVLSARRGSTGGFCLERDPAELTVLEVINAIDPVERIHTCPLGLEAHAQVLCPLHRRIDNVLASIECEFGQTTIKQLIASQAPAHGECTLLTAGGAPTLSNKIGGTQMARPD